MQRHVKNIFVFCKGEGMGRPWPITVDHLKQFGVHLHYKDLAPHTIQGRISALAFHVKAHGCLDLASDFRIRKIIEGWSRESSRHEVTHTSMSPRILVQLGQVWDVVCVDQYEIKLFRSATLCTFLGAFRISELIRSSKLDNSHKALQRDDQ